MQDLMITLGWEMGSHLLIIALSDDKSVCWSIDISKMISNCKASLAKFDTTVGWLERIVHIIPSVHHFLSRLRHLKDKAKSLDLRFMCVGADIMDDLSLHLQLLKKAREGVSMNLLTYREPTIQYQYGACPLGMGRYSMMLGCAWRMEIPDELLFHLSLNTLKFLVNVICIWLDIVEDRIILEDCLLSQTNSISATGWPCKSNFDAIGQQAKPLLARKLAKLMIVSKPCLYSQCLPGVDNDLTYCLSRDHNLCDSDLASLYSHAIPE
jgi:hypothetical protein